ncbi:MAG: CDP-alcohol phosphatidyltransferase [Cenarchaeum symbiont of Oopsacas minuta]|nr:CDP-alcohol phosphatidyltransferase [Cenarchaeum symbiont of Oopsacas minuta]
MLDKLRGVLAPSLEKLGTTFAKTGISPNTWTAVGLCLSIAAAISYTSSEWIEGMQAWHAISLGSVLLLASGFFDIIDGQVARVTKNITKTGGFLDSVSDRIAEVAIFFGMLVGNHANPIVIFLAVTLSLLVSYARSRAESVGVPLRGVGIGERPERLLVVAIIGMVGFLEYALVAVCVMAGVTFVHRVIVATKKS